MRSDVDAGMVTGALRFPAAGGLVWAALITAGLVGCAPDGQERADPTDRIVFRIPADWQEAPGSNGTRFSPPGADSRSVHINMNTGDINPGAGLEQERDVWLAAQVSSGHEVLHSGQWRQDDFEVLEYAHTGEGVHGDIVWHHVLMSNGEYRVMAFLMSAPDVYPEYREVFLRTVRSVSAR
jgi:hypothetical protein